MTNKAAWKINQFLPPSLPPVLPQSQAFFKRSISSFHQNNDAGEGSQQKRRSFTTVGPTWVPHRPAQAEHQSSWKHTAFSGNNGCMCQSGSETFGLLFPLLSAPASFLFLKCCIHPLPPVYVCFKRDFQRYIDHFMHLLLLFYTVEVDFLLTPGTPVQLHLLAVTGHTFLSSFDFELLNHHILGKNFEICMW